MADKDFTHLLLTRFNLDFSPYTHTPYLCDDQWHQDRFKLFNRYCLPSVINQTIQNFEWIIFFNEEKRELYTSFIRETEKALKNVRFLFVKPEEDHRQRLVRYIKKNYSSDYLITTRIDNDDCISSHFMESIQEKFMERRDAFDHEYVLNAGTGYQYEVKFPFRKALIKDYKYSPFLSLFSKLKGCDEINTVLKHAHHRWEEYETSEEMPDHPYWTQIIHENNVSNRILSLNLYVRISDKHFPVLIDTPRNQWWFGLLLLPVQITMTVIKRISEKIKHH